MFYADSYCAIDGRGEGKDKICFKEGEEVPLGGEVFYHQYFYFYLSLVTWVGTVVRKKL